MNGRVPVALAVAAMLSGCSIKETLISPLFKVCAKLPENSTYVLDSRPPVDFDEGVLKVGDKSLSVYTGHNPDFAKKNRLGAPADRNFVYVGKQRGQEIDKILFAQRGMRNEILYVMFSGDGLDTENPLSGVSLSTCKNPQ